MGEPHVYTSASSDAAVAVLVRDAKAGDREAFRGLYDFYSKRLLNFAFKLLTSREEAEDVVQETFTAVFRKLKSLQDDSKFEAWMFRIARNFVYQRYRSRADEHTALELDDELEDEVGALAAPGNDPETELLAGELQDVVAKLIRGLPERYREVFILSAVQGFSYQEIAEIVGKTLPAVKTDIHRARLEVRNKIKRFMGTVADEDV